MGVSILSVVFIIFLVGHFPAPASASFRSWFCGTCTVCQMCPACTPQVNVSPRCECRENLNNCDCRCLTQQHLQEHYGQWSAHLGVAQNNTLITQMNGYLMKRRLLFWLIALSFFNIFLLFLLGFLVFFSPNLLRRWTHWRSTSRLNHRQQIMKKLNLVEPDVSDVTLSSPDPVSPATIARLDRLMVNLTTALQSVPVSSSSPATCTVSRIT